MKKITLLLILIISLVNSLFAQNDKIEVHKSIFGLQYYKNNKQISKSKLSSLLMNNRKAHETFEKGVMNTTFGNITGTIGGFIVGYQLGKSSGTHDIKLPTFLVGLGLCIVSIPLSIEGTRQKVTAVDMYNKSLDKINIKKVSYRLLLKPNGLGLLVKF